MNPTISKLNEIKHQLHENLTLVIDRGEKIDVLEKKASGLNESAILFNRSARKLSLNEKCKLYKLNILIGVLILSAIILLALIIWGTTK